MSDNNLPNKHTRELKEIQNLFGDPKMARNAWKSVGNAILQNPATLSPLQYNKDGDITPASTIEKYTYEHLVKDIKELTKEDRQPTEIEMIMACQIVKARYDTNAAVFVRDTLGAKPVDESKMDATLSANPYEKLTDEELELLAAHRAAAAAQQQLDDQTAPSPAPSASEHLVDGDEHA